MAYQKKTKVGYENGLHIRPCAQLKRVYDAYTAEKQEKQDIRIIKNGNSASLDSAIAMIWLCAKQGDEIIVEGPDSAEDLISRIAEMISFGSYEEE